jgi:hypothetical protein
MSSESGGQGYVIYCDESCQDWAVHHQFMAIGGLKVPRETKPVLSKQLRRLMVSVGLAGEVKWKKVSTKKLESYKALVDFFFEQAALQYRAIVVDQNKVKLKEYHQNDAELAFYKFYYEMLEKWLQPAESYVILLDHRVNRGDDRCVTLWRCLENHFTGNVDITALTTIDSARTPLAQLCDVFTGCLAAINNGINAGTAKAELADYIRDKAGLATLTCGTPLNAEKFNIFKPALR